MNRSKTVLAMIVVAALVGGLVGFATVFIGGSDDVVDATTLYVAEVDAIALAVELPHPHVHGFDGGLDAHAGRASAANDEQEWGQKPCETPVLHTPSMA